MLVQAFLVFEDFQRDKLLLLVIQDAKHDTKTALAELLYDLISKAKVLIVTHHVFLLVCIKAIVCLWVDLAI